MAVGLLLILVLPAIGDAEEALPVEGRAVDVDETGSLLVEGAEGRRRVAFGEVAHLE